MAWKMLSLVFFAAVCLPDNAYAYIDPGTGSLVLQALVAGGITALVFFRNLRDKIFSLFRRDKKREKK